MRAAQPVARHPRGVFAEMRTYAHRSPAAFARRSGAPDGVAAEVGAALAQGLADTFGVVQEYRLPDQPWGFDPSAITAPTHLAGHCGRPGPVEWGTGLEAAIPGTELAVVDGATHFLWDVHWDAILGRLTRR